MGKNAKVSPASSGRILACSIAALLLASAPVAVSQESKWIGTQSGNWSVPANWQGNVVPLGGPDSTLVFNVSATSAITSTNDLAGAFTTSSLNINSTGTELFSVEGNPLHLTGEGAEIVQSGIGNVILATPLVLEPSHGGVVKFHGSGLGDLTIAGAITEAVGPASLLIAGQAKSLKSQVISLLGANSVTGRITLESGNLALSNSMGESNAPFVVKGGSLRFTSLATFANPIVLHSDLLLVGGLSVALGPISSAVPGTGLTLRMTSRMNGALTLSQPSAYTGATRIDFDPTSTLISKTHTAVQLSLTGAGALTGTSLIDVRSRGILFFEGNPAGGVVDRLPDHAPIELRSGGLTFRPIAAPTTAQVETIGALKVAGQSMIRVDIGSITPSRGEIAAASLARMGKGILVLHGVPAAATLPEDYSGGKVTLVVAPEMIGSGTGVTTPIVPYAVSVPPSGFTTPSGLVTYTPGVGLRRLSMNEYASAFGTPDSNVRLTASTANNLDRTINSLVLGGGSLTGSGTLTISSGMVLSTSGTTVSNNLNFGSEDGKIFTQTDLTISGVISGSGGLTKVGDASLRLTGENTFTGPLTINGGAVTFTSPGQLGAPGAPIFFDGQHAQLQYGGSIDVTLNKEVTLASGMARLLGNGGRRVIEINGNITGEGGLFLSAERSGIFRLTGVNTFTGPLVVDAAELEIDSDEALGVGNELEIREGVIRLLGDWTSERPLRIDGGNTSLNALTIDTVTFDGRLAGPVIGGGGRLIKLGEGSLTLISPGTFSDSIFIEEGSFILAGAAELRSTDYSVRRGAKLQSDQTAPGSSSHLNQSTRIVLGGAEFTITGRSGEAAIERVQTLETSSDISVLTLLPGAGANSQATFAFGKLANNGGGVVIRAEDLGANSRVTVEDLNFVRSGVAAGVYSQSIAGGPELLTTYESTSGGLGEIGFRPAVMSATATIQNPGNGGATSESANVLVSAEGAALVGGRNTINSLTIGSAGVIPLQPDQVLRLESGALLRQSGEGVASITGGSLDPGDADARFAIFGDLEITSALVGAGSLRKAGDGALTLTGPISMSGGVAVHGGTLRLTGINSYAGATVVYGNLEINGDAALGNGGALSFYGSRSSLHLDGPLVSNRRIEVNGTTELFLNGYDAVLNGPLEGFSPLLVRGPGEVTLTADSPHSGSIELMSDLLLSGSGALRSRDISAVSGNLTLDNRAVAVLDRLLDTARFSGSSVFTLIGNESAPVSETIGNLIPAALGTQAAIRLVAPGNQGAILDAATHEGMIFSGPNMVRTVAGDDLGGSSGGFTRLIFRSRASTSGLIPATLAASSANGVPESFATYDTTTDQYGQVGVRALREAEYVSSAIIRNDWQGGTIPSNANFLVTTDVTLGAANASISSLTMRGDSRITLALEQTLRVFNGSVLVQSGGIGEIKGGTLALDQAARFFVNGRLDLDSALSAPFFEKFGQGAMRMGSAHFLDSMNIHEGTLVLAGDISNGGAPLGGPILTSKGATLAGSGTIEGHVIMSGTLSPGDEGVGVLHTRGLTLHPGSAVSFGLASAAELDRLEVAGTLVIGGPVALNLTLGYDPLDFVDAFTLIANDGIDPVSLSSGHFTFGEEPLSEGEHFLAQEQLFQISYAGGDGNDVVLRAVPEPSAALLVLNGLVGFLSRRRRPAQRTS